MRAGNQIVSLGNMIVEHNSDHLCELKIAMEVSKIFSHELRKGAFPVGCFKI